MILGRLVMFLHGNLQSHRDLHGRMAVLPILPCSSCIVIVIEARHYRPKFHALDHLPESKSTASAVCVWIAHLLAAVPNHSTILLEALFLVCCRFIDDGSRMCGRPAQSLPAACWMWRACILQRRWNKILSKQTHHRPDKPRQRAEAVKLEVLNPSKIPQYDLRHLAASTLLADGGPMFWRLCLMHLGFGRYSKRDTWMS